MEELLTHIPTQYQGPVIGYCRFLLYFWSGVAIGYLIFFLIERLLPARPLNPKGALISLRASAIYLLLSPIIGAIPIALVNESIRPLYGPIFPIRLNMALLAAKWPEYAAIIAVIPMPFFIYDFFYYWFHRLQHKKLLWPQHKLHHTDHHLNVTTAYRGHWLEDTLRAPLLLMPMGLAFVVTPFQAALVTLVFLHWTLFLHSNLRISMGPLTPIFTGPQYHRIHHSIEPHHQNKNFAAIFPVWDIIFGTYYRPKPSEFPDTGVVGEESNVTTREMLWGPFRDWFHRPKSYPTT
jgi:sterol desaturase/sphingolipid hydroxylase (fatty acid hydroxylase superfamily)